MKNFMERFIPWLERVSAKGYYFVLGDISGNPVTEFFNRRCPCGGKLHFLFETATNLRIVGVSKEEETCYVLSEYEL